MSDVKISALPAAASIASTDVAPVVTGGVTSKVTAQAIVNGGLSGGTANGVLYLDGSKAATSGSALTFDGASFGVNSQLAIKSANPLLFLNSDNTNYMFLSNPAGSGAGLGQLAFTLGGVSELMRLTSTGLGIGTSSPAYKLDVSGSTRFGKAVTDVHYYTGSVTMSSGSALNFSTDPSLCGYPHCANGIAPESYQQSITSGTRIISEPQSAQANLMSSTNGRCGSRFDSSWPAKSPSSFKEPMAISCLFSHRQIGSGVPQ